MLILTFVPMFDTQASVMDHKQGFELAVPVISLKFYNKLCTAADRNCGEVRRENWFQV